MFPEPQAATFLVNSRGGPLDEHNLQHTFAPLVERAGRLVAIEKDADLVPALRERFPSAR